jgi:hypothetical protein
MQFARFLLGITRCNMVVSHGNILCCGVWIQLLRSVNRLGKASEG